MLISLSIQNVVLIESLEINLRSGLCALTGETGAGKSILLDSLGLALGARSDSGLVRKGADQASVIATFEVNQDHESLETIRNADLQLDQALILRRTVSGDGRSRAYINDQPVSAGLLKQVGAALVEIHGQFDTQSLLDPLTHHQMLDSYGEVGGDVQNIWNSWRAVKRRLKDFIDAAENIKNEEDYLRQALEDIDALAPKPGEEAELAGLRERLMNREKVLEALDQAYQVLSGDDPVRTAWGVLERISGKAGDDLDDAIAALARSSSETQEALSLIQSISTNLQDSEHNLQSIDDRLFALRAQARKHKCEVDDLADKRRQLAEKLDAIEHADEHLAQAMKEAEQKKHDYYESAKALSERRIKVARKLDQLVEGELGPLKLDKAKFVTQVTPQNDEAHWGPNGIDDIQFLVSTNPGSDPGPLNKIASGGEMARFMLALKVVMADVGSAGTLVFDEVDSGIGGATADAVGRRLARLAEKCQVLVVTHSPQVAAKASAHYIVQKDGEAQLTTNVVYLHAPGDRRHEIARMLSGEVITPEAEAAADKLLETGT